MTIPTSCWGLAFKAQGVRAMVFFLGGGGVVRGLGFIWFLDFQLRDDV